MDFFGRDIFGILGRRDRRQRLPDLSTITQSPNQFLGKFKFGFSLLNFMEALNPIDGDLNWFQLQIPSEIFVCSRALPSILSGLPGVYSCILQIPHWSLLITMCPLTFPSIGNWLSIGLPKLSNCFWSICLKILPHGRPRF